MIDDNQDLSQHLDIYSEEPIETIRFTIAHLENFFLF